MVDAVRLARLEAQAYWDETFVDLYDFCELLLRRCRDAFSTQLKQFVVFDELFLSDKYKASEAGDKPASRTLDEGKLKRWFLDTEGGRLWQKIHDACLAVLNEFKPDNRKRGYSPLFVLRLPKPAILPRPVNLFPLDTARGCNPL